LRCDCCFGTGYGLHDGEPKPRKMSALAAAAKVLGEQAKPMNCHELIDEMSRKNYWTSAPRSPACRQRGRHHEGRNDRDSRQRPQAPPDQTAACCGRRPQGNPGPACAV
jgi:hypothetical protein